MKSSDKNYEIWKNRFDVSPERYTKFSCSSDEEAIKEFEKVKKNPNMRYERLELVEVLTERTTRRIMS